MTIHSEELGEPQKTFCSHSVNNQFFFYKVVVQVGCGNRPGYKSKRKCKYIRKYITSIILMLFDKIGNMVYEVYDFYKYIKALNDPFLQIHQDDFGESDMNGRKCYVSTRYETTDHDYSLGKPMRISLFIKKYFYLFFEAPIVQRQNDDIE